MCEKKRCVIVGGAEIGNYRKVRSYLRGSDFIVYCDSGLKHMEKLGAAPSLIIGDWDSHADPHLDVETITLPVAKDDTDTVYAMREGMKRGFKKFLLIGSAGERLDHTLVNVYILTTLENRGLHGMIVDDYSEMELISSWTDEEGNCHPGEAAVEDRYTIKNAKFGLEGAAIGPDYQYATSNEVIPGKTAEITVEDGRLLLIKIN